MGKKYNKNPDFISENEKKYLYDYLYTNYYKLICALTKNYWRYFTPNIGYEDICHDVFIGLCKVYSYRYNFKNIDQKYFILTSILQLLDTRFPKKIDKVKWEQSRISMDAPEYYNKKQRESHKPCESTVICKNFVDNLFVFIKNMPVDRFYGNDKALDILCFIKQHFLKLSDYELYDLPHIIDLLAYNLYLCEIGHDRRGKLFNTYKRYLHQNNIRKYANTQLHPNHIFNTVCNYFLVRLRIHLYKQGLYDYLMKGDEQ